MEGGGGGLFCFLKLPYLLKFLNHFVVDFVQNGTLSNQFNKFAFIWEFKT